MLLELGNGGRSVQYPFNISHATQQLPNVHVTMTIYPRLLHQVKSRLRGGCSLPTQVRTLRVRELVFQQVIGELMQLESQ